MKSDETISTENEEDEVYRAILAVPGVLDIKFNTRGMGGHDATAIYEGTHRVTGSGDSKLDALRNCLKAVRVSHNARHGT